MAARIQEGGGGMGSSSNVKVVKSTSSLARDIKNIKATLDWNQYNLNDFMAKNNIIDSNVYIQPGNYSKNIPSANMPRNLLSVPNITKL